MRDTLTVAEMTTDDHYLRNPANRYRVYRLRGGSATVLGTSPNAGGIGEGLVAWADDGDLLDVDRIGVLDCAGEAGDDAELDEHGCYTGGGRWIVNPYGR